MGEVTDRAADLAQQIKTAGVHRVYTDIRKVETPCVLVVPVPAYVFELMCTAATVTWSLIVLGRKPADLGSARQMEEILLKVAKALPIESAAPSSYQIPGTSELLPAYTLTMTDDLEIEP